MINILKKIKTNVKFEAEEHRYWYNNEEIPSVTEIIKRMYPMGTIDNPELLEFGQTRGSYVHAYLEEKYSNKKVLDDYKNEIGSNSKYVEYFPVWNDMSEKGYKELERIYPNKDFVLTEVALAHPKLKYAGTFDQMFLYGKKLILVDFKTSSHMKDNMYNNLDKVKMQLAAYSLIIRELYNLEISKFEVLHITKYNVELIEVEPDYDKFMEALNMDN